MGFNDGGVSDNANVLAMAEVQSRNLFGKDGTLFDAYANVVLEAFELGYGENVSPMTEREMVERAGAIYGGQDTLNLDWPAYVLSAPNHLPVAAPDRYVAEQGSVLSRDAVAGLLGNDADLDLDPLKAKLADGGPRHGTLTLSASGSFTYAPTQGYVGTDSFSYMASDGYGNSRVHKYSPDGKLLLSWGEPGCDPGQFNIVHNICTAKDGWVYVADRENHRIQKFAPDGKPFDLPELASPCWLALAELVGDYAYLFDAVALTECRALSFGRKNLALALEARDAAAFVMEALAREVALIHRVIASSDAR